MIHGSDGLSAKTRSVMRALPRPTQLCIKPDFTQVLRLEYISTHALATVETEMKTMSPAERVQTFINQIIVWDAAFHTERKNYHDTHNTEYRCRADAGAKAQLIDIFSEILVQKS